MKNFKKIITILKKGFNANLEAHKYSQESQDCYYSDDHSGASFNSYLKSQKYAIKTEKIKEAISFIKKNNIPVKYGWGKDEDGEKNLIYFSLNDEQVSFHFFGSFRGIKKYKGSWKGQKNKSFPIKKPYASIL